MPKKPGYEKQIDSLFASTIQPAIYEDIDPRYQKEAVAYFKKVAATYEFYIEE